jgi:hypothetical protein
LKKERKKTYIFYFLKVGIGESGNRGIGESSFVDTTFKHQPPLRD